MLIADTLNLLTHGVASFVSRALIRCLNSAVMFGFDFHRSSFSLV